MSAKAVKMVFPEDKFVDNEIFAKKGVPVLVQPGSIQRWLIRGGVIVEPVVADGAAVEGGSEGGEKGEGAKVAPQGGKKTDK